MGLAILFGIIVLILIIGFLLGLRTVISEEIEIKAPIEKVWELISNPVEFNQLPVRNKWAPIVDYVKLISGEAGKKDAVYEIKGSFLGKPYFAEIKIHEISPPKLFVTKLLKDSLKSQRNFIYVLNKFELTPINDKATKVKLTYQSSTYRPMYGLLKFLWTRPLKELNHATLEALKDEIETPKNYQV